MSINTSLASGASCGDTRLSAFAELKRRVRAVRSRLRRGPTGGAGVAPGPDANTHIDKLIDTNILQKAPPASPAPDLAPISPETPHVSVAVALTREDNWRSAGDIKAIIAGRSINPRILEVLLPSGERGRAIVKPSEHPKFGQKKPVWVRKDDRGKHWVVVGRYSQWGVRCE